MSLATRRAPRALAPWLVALGVLAALAVGPLAGPAAADDGVAAWSVTPATAEGAADARTRLDLQLDPGGTAHDQVLVANASTTEQTFNVYAADAFNTADGGYDLLAAAKPSVDVGTWVSVDQPTVTIPALATAVVQLDVAVPAGATPGDHAGGLVVSLAHPEAGTDGVVIDSRVALRLTVRVSGELTPALEVRDVGASAGTSLVPFGASTTTVRYRLVNTGNVKIVGTPRVRVTGPFGLGRVEVAPGDTAEVLPGQSFTVETQVPGVLPLIVTTATVDVAMVAAPGPDTTVPLTSSSARAVYLSVPWSGLLVLALLVGAAALVVLARRRRRAEGERLWRLMVAGGGTGGEGAVVGGTPAGATHAVVLAVVLLLAAAGLAPGAVLSADESDTGTITLQVPRATATPTATTTATPTPTSSSTSQGTSAGSHSHSSSGAGTAAGVVTGDAGTSGAGAADPTPTPTPSATALAAEPDTVWREPRRLGPVQWLLIALAAIGASIAIGFGARAWMLRSRTVGGAA